MGMQWDSFFVQTLIVCGTLLAGVLAAMRGAHPINFWISRICFVAIAADLSALVFYKVFSQAGVHPLEAMAATFGVGVIFMGLVWSLAWIEHESWVNSPYLKPNNLPDPRQVPDMPDLKGLPPALAARIGNPADSLFVHFGTNIAGGSLMPHTILEMNGEPMIVVNRDKRGNLVIQTLKIFDANGDIVVWIDNGKIRRGPSSMDPERPNAHTIIVHDRTAAEVLHLTFVNYRSLSLTGLFRHKGVPPVQIFDDHAQINGARLSGGVFFGNRADIAVRGGGGGGFAVQ